MNVINALDTFKLAVIKYFRCDFAPYVEDLINRNTGKKYNVYVYKPTTSPLTSP